MQTEKIFKTVFAAYLAQVLVNYLTTVTLLHDNH